jgi:hypothetical protein
MRRGLGILAAVASLWAAAPAAAEPIVSLGPLRGEPSAVTDAAGTLHAITTVRARVLTGADPYANASWTPWRAVRHMPGIAAFAGFGPNGTWLLTQGSVAFSGFAVWRWNGKRFAKPRSLGTIGGRARSNVIGGVRIGNVYPPAFQQTPAGACTRSGSASAPAPRLPRLPAHEPRGFGPEVVYPLATNDARAYAIAANAGGSGWIVYSDFPPSTRAPTMPCRSSRPRAAAASARGASAVRGSPCPPTRRAS